MLRNGPFLSFIFSGKTWTQGDYALRFALRNDNLMLRNGPSLSSSLKKKMWAQDDW